MHDSAQQDAEWTVNTAAQLHDKPLAVSAGRGLSWLLEGWALLIKAPAVFVAMSLISLVAIFIINLIPVVGGVVSTLFWPVMTAGFFLAFRHAQQQEAVTANDLFEPFKAPASLMGVGALYLLAGIMVMLMLLVIAFFSFGSFSAIANGQIDSEQMGVGMIITVLAAIPVSMAFAMAFVFAPVLVHQHQMPVIAAIKRSFVGSLRNIVPFIVFFALFLMCFFALSLLMVIPLLGWLLSIVVGIIYLPWFCGALFCAYSDIFLIHPRTEF